MIGGLKQQSPLMDWEREMIVERAKKSAPKMRYVVGLDLGQVNDPTALIVDEIEGVGPTQTHDIRKIQRWLGVSYTEVVDSVVNLFENPLLKNHTLVIDHTGVGRAVYDMFVKAKPKCSIRPVTITAGSAASPDGPGWKVAKIQLVSVIQALLGTRRLVIEKDQPDAATLVKELRNFQVKVNARTGNESYEAWREGNANDDIVLAAAIGCWVAEHGQKELWVY